VSLIEQKYYTALAHVQARKCRTGGASDGHFGRVFEAVSEIGRGLAGKPSKQIRLAFYEKFQSYGIDPATIMLLVQLALLIYKALKAGRLVRPLKCDRCRTRCYPDAHHFDYIKRLEVKWLCRKCHSNEHH